jgi:rhombotail lipoprotein
MKLLKNTITLAGILIIAVTLSGCSTATRHYSSSVVQYLYPNQKETIQEPDIPVLSLPLKVGIAFVPGTNVDIKSNAPAHMVDSSALSETDKMALMQEVAKHFRKYEFVKSIDLIPSAYLRQEGSFDNLRQIQTMYGIDVIALLSFDQSQFTDEGASAVSYWTILGAYVVKGEKNDTHTMLDAAVFDISSRKMLFRAPGLSQIQGTATPVNLSEQVRRDRAAGFQEASKDLIVNLDEQLALFKEKIKEMPEEYNVVHKAGYTGAGSIGAGFALPLLLCGGIALWRGRKK